MKKNVVWTLRHKETKLLVNPFGFATSGLAFLTKKEASEYLLILKQEVNKDVIHFCNLIVFLALKDEFDKIEVVKFEKI